MDNDLFDLTYEKEQVNEKGESIKKDLSNRYKTVKYIAVILLIILIVIYLFSILFSVLHEVVNFVLDGTWETDIALNVNSTAWQYVRADTITHGILTGILLVGVCFPCIIVAVLSMSSESRYIVGQGFTRIVTFNTDSVGIGECCGIFVYVVWIITPVIVQALIQIKNIVFIYLYHSNYTSGLVIPLLFMYFQLATFVIVVIGLFIILIGYAIYATMNWDILKADKDVKETFDSNEPVKNKATQEKIKNLSLKRYNKDYFNV